MSLHLLQVSSGNGPIEVRRFVALLADRIEALCEARGLVVDEVVVHGDAAAPRSVELVAAGEASALLGDELGTHALVAASRGRGARKRWFAAVTLHAYEPPRGSVALDPADLEITATTAGGPGGQHVNRTATAVRIRHRPTGIVVRISGERSQRANREHAERTLAARLAEAAERRRADDGASRRLQHHRLERGAPVRVYGLDERGALAERGR